MSTDKPSSSAGTPNSRARSEPSKVVAKPPAVIEKTPASAAHKQDRKPAVNFTPIDLGPDLDRTPVTPGVPTRFNMSLGSSLSAVDAGSQSLRITPPALPMMQQSSDHSLAVRSGLSSAQPSAPSIIPPSTANRLDIHGSAGSESSLSIQSARQSVKDRTDGSGIDTLRPLSISTQVMDKYSQVRIAPPAQVPSYDTRQELGTGKVAPAALPATRELTPPSLNRSIRQDSSLLAPLSSPTIFNDYKNTSVDDSIYFQTQGIARYARTYDPFGG